MTVHASSRRGLWPTRSRGPAALVLAVALAGAPLGASGGVAHADPAATRADASQASEACADGAPTGGFPDAAGNFHEASIDCVAWYGVARGGRLGAYEPGAEVQRDQMATFVVRALEAAGAELPDPGEPDFPDVREGSTHAGAIDQLARLGIVRGDDGAYGPGEPVSRGQMATFLVRAYEHLHGELAATDSGFRDRGRTHAVNIDKAYAAGFARGTSATTYEPQRPVGRDQMASFLTRLLDRAAQDGYLTALTPPEPTLSDESRLHPRGIGPVEVGSTLAEIEQQTGSTLDVFEFETFRRQCYYARPQGAPAISFLVLAPGGVPPADPHDGVAVRVSSTTYDASVTATTAEVRPGDAGSDVLDAYGSGQVRESEHVYQPGGRYLDVAAADGEHGLRFEVDPSGTVAAIHAGDADAVRWIEGCA